MPAKQITHRNIVKVLLGGFTLVILLLVASAVIGARNVQSIQESAARLVAEQLLTNQLIEGVQREQAALRAVFYNFAHDLESVDRDQVLSQLDRTDQTIDEMVAATEGTPEEHLWREFDKSEKAFASEARRLLALEDYSALTTRKLFQRHEEVFAIVAKLISASYQKAAAQQQLAGQSRQLARQSFWLVGACLVLALFCAVLTVKMTTALFRKMEWQTGELSRVSWHMLESQETTARRFSHELHDELGQSLTAVKANLLTLQTDGLADNKRLQDCGQLVDDAIRNVRELSQLLRPTILDDFGLDASLHWLGERFTERTRIEVDYSSNFTGRLADEVETHLFRIAQEALTNAARHSHASHVKIRLRGEGKEKRLYLRIEDNGQGLAEGEVAAGDGLGMIGMRARARSTGGELTIRSSPGGGVTIEVWAPMESEQHEAKDPHFVG